MDLHHAQSEHPRLPFTLQYTALGLASDASRSGGFLDPVCVGLLGAGEHADLSSMNMCHHYQEKIHAFHLVTTGIESKAIEGNDQLRTEAGP